MKREDKPRPIQDTLRAYVQAELAPVTPDEYFQVLQETSAVFTRKREEQYEAAKKLADAFGPPTKTEEKP